MATLTIKGISDDVLDRLRKRAEANRRSLNSEALFTLESAVGRRPIDPDAFLERIRRRRERLNVSEMSPEFLREAREEGRA